jgi:hypothetical protein
MMILPASSHSTLRNFLQRVFLSAEFSATCFVSVGFSVVCFNICGINRDMGGFYYRKKEKSAIWQGKFLHAPEPFSKPGESF